MTPAPVGGTTFVRLRAGTQTSDGLELGRAASSEFYIPASLLALGFRDADINIGSTASQVPPDRVVANVQTSGAGTSDLAAAMR